MKRYILTCRSAAPSMPEEPTPTWNNRSGHRFLMTRVNEMNAPKTAESPVCWQDSLFEFLVENGVTQISHVPDAGHSILIERSANEPRVHSVGLASEQEGVALAAGADLGGEKAVLLMQSSGVGNCINMLSLMKGSRFPFLTFVTMRGEYGEGNPWQYPMGQAVQPVLEAMGVICLRVERPEDVIPTAGAAMTMVWKSEQRVAVLLAQKLLGAKKF